MLATARDPRDEGVDVVAAGEPGCDAGEDAAVAWAREALLREPGAGAAE